MYTRHEDYEGRVNASPDQLFELLDDQTRLSAHMTKRLWKMGWGKTDILLDEKRGRAVGSHIVLRGRVFGIPIFLDEAVTLREPPLRKGWETVGQPRLLVIGPYRMRFAITSGRGDLLLRVEIDYEIPPHGLARVLGRLFGRSYAKWCTKKMVQDAQAVFPGVK
jgi:hypothetical protein